MYSTSCTRQSFDLIWIAFFSPLEPLLCTSFLKTLSISSVWGRVLLWKQHKINLTLLRTLSVQWKHICAWTGTRRQSCRFCFCLTLWVIKNIQYSMMVIFGCTEYCQHILFQTCEHKHVKHFYCGQELPVNVVSDLFGANLNFNRQKMYQTVKKSNIHSTSCFTQDEKCLFVFFWFSVSWVYFVMFPH